MKKRNFILLIAILVLMALAVLVYFLAKGTPNTPSGEGGGVINFLSDLIPFGKKNKPPGDQPIDISDYRDETIAEVGVLTLTKVSSMPVAGYGSFQKERFVELPQVIPGSPQSQADPNPTAPPTEFVAALRYTDRATGNIFQTYADRINERKFIDMAIPKVGEAIYGNKASTVVVRYLRPDLETIASFVGRLPIDTLGADTTSRKVEGSFLPENVTDLSWSSDMSEMLYLYDIQNNSIGIIADSAGENKQQIFDLPYTEWLSTWPNSDLITLTTKASGKFPGFMYTFSPSSKDFRKVLGEINGLTTLTSPNGIYVLYGNDNLDVSLYDMQTRERRALSVNTLPEKCVWGKDNITLYCAVPKLDELGSYPDSWYQGEVSFEDEIWKIDTGTFTETKILDLKDNTEKIELDAIKIGLSEDGDYLFFVNKKDSYLWELRLR